MSNGVKGIILLALFGLMGHLEYRDQKFQDEMREQRIKQQKLERDLHYWVPAPTCDDCHTIRGTKGQRR